jgi:hypothetical protein
MHKWRFEPTADNARPDAVYTFYSYALVVQDNISNKEREGAWLASDRLCDIQRFP